MNPLQRMLGTYMRVQRRRAGKHGDDIADQLGLARSYYRLVESGRAMLNQSLIFKIMELFAYSDDAERQRPILFQQLSMYLAGTHWINSRMVKDSDHQSDEKWMQELAKSAREFQIFYDRTGEYFSLNKDESKQRKFLEEISAPEVGVFLTTENYGNPVGAAKDFLQLGDVPTLNIEIIANIKRALADRLFVHTGDVAAKWENDRRAEIRSAQGLFADANLIVSRENLRNFHYAHLSAPQFDLHRIIFMKGLDGGKDTKAEFIGNLDDGRAAAGLKPLTQAEKDKLCIKCLTTQQSRSYRRTLENLLTRDGLPHQAYWSFRTTLDLWIGFVGVAHGNTENIRNLTLAISELNAESFENLWKALDAQN